MDGLQKRKTDHQQGLWRYHGQDASPSQTSVCSSRAKLCETADDIFPPLFPGYFTRRGEERKAKEKRNHLNSNLSSSLFRTVEEEDAKFCLKYRARSQLTDEIGRENKKINIKKTGVALAWPKV